MADHSMKSPRSLITQSRAIEVEREKMAQVGTKKIRFEYVF